MKLFLKSLILLTLLCASSVSMAQNKESAKLKAEQRSIQNKINNTKSLIKATRSSKQLTMAEIWIIKNLVR